jgi:DNA primase
MQLLLERPALAERVDNIPLLLQAGVPGIDVLIEAVDFFHAHPEAHAGQLVAAWKDEPRGRAVARLLAQGSPELDDAAIDAEFVDAIERLKVRALEVEATRLLAESARRELSGPELEIIRMHHSQRPPRSKR